MEKDYSYKEHLIPKKNGKFRKIVAPSKDLLNYQQSKLKYIEKVYKAEVTKHNIENIIHGFVPGKNCVTAAKQHIGFNTTIVMDLADFVDTVNKIMFAYVRYIDIHQDSKFFHKDGYCAQGFATSPMLANIAFIPAIIEINSYLKNMPGKTAFTIYADDLQISTNSRDSEYINDKIIKPITKIIEKHKFKVNQNKTRIRYAHYGYRKILGINVGDTKLTGTRKIMRKIRAANHQENGQSLGGLITWSKCYEPKQTK